MPRRFGDGADDLGQQRSIQLTNKVDRWAHELAARQRRSVSWVIRDIITQAYERDQARGPRLAAKG